VKDKEMNQAATSAHRISGTTKLVGIIGWPVEHSLSPAMHNAAFAELGLDWAYLPLPVYPDHLGDAIRGLQATGFSGANVTVPHKQAVMQYLDDISHDAQVIGAVNTISIRDGQLFGDNTDAPGFLQSLRDAGFETDEARAAVVGAGGAARAVVHALSQAGVRQLTLFSRRREQAEQLCKDISRFHPNTQFVAHSLTELGAAKAHIDLLVNTTPVGMWPDTEHSPWPQDTPMPARAFVCDLIYNPADSLFLRQARAAGAVTLNGLGMLVAQGALAFETWTDIPPSISTMKTACLQAMGRSK
jgi:shikimate dehydrogenase